MTVSQVRDLILFLLAIALIVGGLFFMPWTATRIVIGLFLIVLGFAFFEKVGK